MSVAPHPVYAGLSGHITHSEFLTPVAQESDIGQIFESTSLYKKMLASQTGLMRKYLVPAWLAGTWSRTESTETSRIELPSGRKIQPTGEGVAKVTDKFGSYKDGLNLIWQNFDPAHSSGSVDRGATVDYHVVSQYNLASIGNTMAIVEVRAFHAVVDKKTKRVISAYQDEELNTYTRVSDGLVKTDSSVKVFDVNGRPKLLTRAVSTESRVAAFGQ